MIQTAIARRYAKALFNLLDTSAISPAAETLAHLAEAFAESKDLRALLRGPLFSREQKTAVVRTLAGRLGASPMVERFLLHLIRKNRIGQLPEVSDAFTKLADQAAHRLAVIVASPHPLSEDARTSLQKRLENASNSAIELTTKVDPGLIGGLEIRIGSTVYDGSVRGQLERLRSALTQAG